MLKLESLPSASRQGRVMETGDHDQLMATGGRYASLVNAQTMPGEGHHATARH